MAGRAYARERRHLSSPFKERGAEANSIACANTQEKLDSCRCARLQCKRGGQRV